MKGLMIILVIIIMGLLVVSTGSAFANDSDKIAQGNIYIPPYEYMPPASVYYVFSHKGELLNIGIDLRHIPLIHIAYYLPAKSRCVIYEMWRPPKVIYAIGEGCHILPPPIPAIPYSISIP